MQGAWILSLWCVESHPFLLYVLQHIQTTGAIPLGSDVFRSLQRDRLPGITNMTCTGSEPRLSDCAYEQQTGDCETAAIICQSELAIY